MRISPSTVLAGAALFFALGGSAVAVTEAVKPQARCQPGAVRGYIAVNGDPRRASRTFPISSRAQSPRSARGSTAPERRRRHAVSTSGVYEVRFPGNAAQVAVGQLRHRGDDDRLRRRRCVPDQPLGAGPPGRRRHVVQRPRRVGDSADRRRRPPAAQHDVRAPRGARACAHGGRGRARRRSRRPSRACRLVAPPRRPCPRAAARRPGAPDGRPVLRRSDALPRARRRTLVVRELRLGRVRHLRRARTSTGASRPSARTAANRSRSTSATSVPTTRASSSTASCRRRGGGTTSASPEARCPSSGRRSTSTAGSTGGHPSDAAGRAASALAHAWWGDRLGSRLAAAHAGGEPGDPRARRAHGRVLAPPLGVRGCSNVTRGRRARAAPRR